MMNQLYTELIEIVKVIQKVKLIYQKYQFLKLLDGKKANQTVKKCIQQIKSGSNEKKKQKRPKEIKKLFNFMHQNDEQEFELAYSMLMNVIGIPGNEDKNQQKEQLLMVTPKMQEIIKTELDSFLNYNITLSEEILEIVLINNP